MGSNPTLSAIALKNSFLRNFRSESFAPRTESHYLKLWDLSHWVGASVRKGSQDSGRFKLNELNSAYGSREHPRHVKVVAV